MAQDCEPGCSFLQEICLYSRVCQLFWMGSYEIRTVVNSQGFVGNIIKAMNPHTHVPIRINLIALVRFTYHSAIIRSKC